MRFRNKESQLMWERYVDPYSTLPQYDQTQTDPTVTDPYMAPEEEAEVSVMEFEPTTGLEVEEQSYNEVVYSDVKKLAEYSQRLLEICKEKELEPWMQAKLVKASDYVSDIWHRLDAEADFANTGFEQSDNIEF
jgi:hypothetical protein